MIAFLLFVVLMGVVSSVLYYSLKTGISPLPTNPKVAKIISLHVGKFEHKKVVDLGSGFGFLIIYLALKNPKKEFVGIEISPFIYLFSLLLKKSLHVENLTFKRADFRELEFDGSELFVVYGCPKVMSEIKTIVTTQALISSTFALRGVKADETINVNDLFKTPIFIYKSR